MVLSLPAEGGNLQALRLGPTPVHLHPKARMLFISPRTRTTTLAELRIALLHASIMTTHATQRNALPFVPTLRLRLSARGPAASLTNAPNEHFPAADYTIHSELIRGSRMHRANR
jgi:hypothetical protein